MHRVAVLTLLVWAAVLSAQAPADEYLARREAVRKSLADSVLVLFGRTEKEADELHSGFIQEPNFYYLTGWEEPGAILLVSSGAETLFLPNRNEVAERYTGRKLAPGDGDVQARTGFTRVLPVSRFESELLKALESASRLMTPASGPHTARLRELAPMRELTDAAPALARRRARKSATEIARIQRATDVTLEAHRAAWRRIAEGAHEYQVAAAFSFALLDRGCERNAYTPIVGSGPNAVVLHYWKNSRRMEAGDLVLIDAGAECQSYASDVTRTLPVSGKFTPRQRELYEIVLGAQNAAIAAVKPGATMDEINRVARDYINSHGKDREGASLGKYLLHRISHGVGLEVHDSPSASSRDRFEPGVVITIEPGLYIAEEGIGIRIEDVVVVTENGARVMSAALPKDPDEIEKALRK